MPTVTNPETGEEVEVREVHATGISANISATSTEFEASDASFIQAYMTKAVEAAYREGVMNPEKIREAILAAREEAKEHIRRIREEKQKEATIARQEAMRSTAEEAAKKQ